MRRYLAPLCLVGVSLLAGELALRAAALGSLTARRALSPPWAVSAVTVDDDRLGVRGNLLHPDHDAAGYRNLRRPASAEIVALGDSHTYGSGVTADAAWPRRLGREVYNMALPGHGPAHGALLLEDALALGPRVMIVAPYLGNDFLDAWALAHKHRPDLLAVAGDDLAAAAARAEQARPVRSIRPPFDLGDARAHEVSGTRGWLSRHVTLYAFARALYHRTARPAPIEALSRDFQRTMAALPSEQRGAVWPVDADGWRTVLTPTYRGAGLDRHDPRVQAGAAIVLASLRQLHARCRARGVRLLVVLIPTKESVFWPRVGDDAPPALRALVADETYWRGILASGLAEAAITTVDALPALRASPRQPYFEDVDSHPNEDGHAVIAALVAARLGDARGDARPAAGGRLDTPPTGPYKAVGAEGDPPAVSNPRRGA